MASTKGGSKRSKNEGDWTCPKCGNHNFSFRPVCNRSQCDALRPSPSPARIGSSNLQGPGTYDQPQPYFVGGVGVPHSVPLGMSSGYGMEMPFAGMRYGYGASAGAPGSYGLFPGYGPPGPMAGLNYGPVAGEMDRFGYGFHASPMPVPSSWPVEVPDNNASRKRRGGPDGSAEGDWVCPKCDNVNFSFRTSCNMKNCGAPRPTPGPNGKKNSGAPPGSWTCEKCGNVNYPFRDICNKKGCDNPKPDGDE